MSFEKIAINFFVAIMELTITFELCRKVSQKKERIKSLTLLLSVIYLVFSVIVTLFIESPPLLLVFNSIILLCLALSFRMQIGVAIIAIASFQILSVGYEMLVSLLVSAIFNQPIETLVNSNIESYAVVASICKYLLYFTMRLIIKIINPNVQKVSFKYAAIHLIMPISSFIVLFIQSSLVFGSDDHLFRIVLMISSFVIVLSNISAFIIYDLFEKNELKLSQREKRIAELDIEKECYEKNIEMMIKSNKTLHDLKHKLFVISEYVSESDAKAKEIITDLCHIVKSAQIVGYTERPGLDAMLNAKFNEIMENGVGLEKTIALDKLFIDEIELGVIIGNLLDNALEAALKVDNDERKILFSLIQRDEVIAIKLINTTINEKIEIGRSTKNSKTIHGYGLVNIKELVEKYDGDIQFAITDGKCSIGIMMKNREI